MALSDAAAAMAARWRERAAHCSKDAPSASDVRRFYTDPPILFSCGSARNLLRSTVARCALSAEFLPKLHADTVAVQSINNDAARGGGDTNSSDAGAEAHRLSLFQHSFAQVLQRCGCLLCRD